MKSQKLKIAIFTGNRAEYGLQYPIIKAIHEHPKLEPYLLVSGAHLDEDFGFTIKEIEKDGFRVYREVKMERSEDTLKGTVKAIGSCIANLSEILFELHPDFLVVYADRFEGFSALITGTQMNIPTAHVEGGDVTQGGALDDSVRHAMTKLAHLHFTTNEEAARRIASMGEEPWRIHNVGLPILDLVQQGIFAEPGEIEARYGIDPKAPLVLFTQHSVTTEFQLARAQVTPSLQAMQRLAQEDVQIIVTYPNNDAGGKAIIEEILKLRNLKIPNMHFFDSLGRYDYHGFLYLCGRAGVGVCAGNSSSGIKETPAFGCPAVNIGSRQEGRLRGDNIIDVPYDAQKIYDAISRSLKDEDWRRVCAQTANPYGGGNAGEQIANVLSEIESGASLIQKKFVIHSSVNFVHE